MAIGKSNIEHFNIFSNLLFKALIDSFPIAFYINKEDFIIHVRLATTLELIKETQKELDYVKAETFFFNQIGNIVSSDLCNADDKRKKIKDHLDQELNRLGEFSKQVDEEQDKLTKIFDATVDFLEREQFIVEVTGAPVINHFDLAGKSGNHTEYKNGLVLTGKGLMHLDMEIKNEDISKKGFTYRSFLSENIETDFHEGKMAIKGVTALRALSVAVPIIQQAVPIAFKLAKYYGY